MSNVERLFPLAKDNICLKNVFVVPKLRHQRSENTTADEEGDKKGKRVGLCIHLRLGIDFPLTSFAASGSSVVGSSVVAPPPPPFFCLAEERSPPSRDRDTPSSPEAVPEVLAPMPSSVDACQKIEKSVHQGRFVGTELAGFLEAEVQAKFGGGRKLFVAGT